MTIKPNCIGWGLALSLPFWILFICLYVNCSHPLSSSQRTEMAQTQASLHSLADVAVLMKRFVYTDYQPFAPSIETVFASQLRGDCKTAAVLGQWALNSIGMPARIVSLSRDDDYHAVAVALDGTVFISNNDVVTLPAGCDYKAAILTWFTPAYTGWHEGVMKECGATYYLNAVTGNDNNAGTLAAPWETLAVVNRTSFSAGDIIYLTGGQVFGACQRDTCLVVPSNNVTFTSDVNNKATITAARQISGWTNANQAANVYKRVKTIPDSSYAIWINSVLGTRVMTEATLNGDKKWIAWPDSTKIYVTAAGDTGKVWRSKSITVTSSRNYVTFQNLRVSMGTGQNPTGTSCTNILLSAGIGVVISKCEVDSGGFANIRVVSSPTTIEYSTFKYGNGSDNIYCVSDSLRMYNNTIIGGTYNLRVAATQAGTVVNNCIFYAPTTNFVNYMGSSTFISSNNLYYSTSYTNKWSLNGGNYSTLSAWQTATSQDAHSKTGDPLLNASYKPTRNSPALDSGTPITGLTSDFEDNPIVGLPDLGCFEMNYINYTPSGNFVFLGGTHTKGLKVYPLSTTPSPALRTYPFYAGENGAYIKKH